MIYMYSFAGLNMGNYPPVASAGLAKACSLFASTVQEEAFGEPKSARQWRLGRPSCFSLRRLCCGEPTPSWHVWQVAFLKGGC